MHSGRLCVLCVSALLLATLIREALTRRDPAVPRFLRWAAAQPALQGLGVIAELLQAAGLPGPTAG